jgi:hypothetical protein
MSSGASPGLSGCAQAPDALRTALAAEGRQFRRVTSTGDAMPRPVLFVQGGGEGAHQEDAALAASLAGALGADYRVVYPAMPEAPDATTADWTRRIADEAAALGDGVILVGHSIGATLVLVALADDAPGRGRWPAVAGVFLVAAPFVGPGGWEIDFALPPDLAQRLPRGVPLAFYHSPDDETVPFAHAGLYAAQLPGARFRRVDSRDHQFDEDLAVVAADIARLG